MGDGSTELSNYILEVMECPVCFDTMYPPIYQCSNGHGICSKCKNTVNNKCPTCRGDLGEIRCLLAEKLLATMRLKCMYRTIGCQESVSYVSKSFHEKSCRFRPYRCPHSRFGCEFNGKDIQVLVAHMKTEHRSTLEVAHVIDTTLSSHTTHIYQYRDDYFCLEMNKLSNGRLYGLVLRFMGEEDDARKYRYSLKIRKTVNDVKRKMTWDGFPNSIRDTKQQILQRGELMIVHSNFAGEFSKGVVSDIHVDGLIWKLED